MTLPEDELKIYASYIGDSGYIILRQGQEKYTLHHESQSQQKGFNFPFQLGWNGNGDTPDKSLSFEHDAQPGDIVILGTDGVFDNISGEDVTSLVNQHLSSNKFKAKELAELIANKSFELSFSETHRSPFAIEAQKYGYRYEGGKSDDITVVVGRVMNNSIDEVDL